MVSNQSIGFFHQDDLLVQWKAKIEQFYLRSSMPHCYPMQFRHANLNNYSHGPSYAFGNSYASPQVASIRPAK